MITMGKWFRKNGAIWQLLNEEQTHYAQVSLSKGGWVWKIANEEGTLEWGISPTRRSRKARKQAQKALLRYV